VPLREDVTRKSCAELEQLVEEQTIALVQARESLNTEIALRRRADEELQVREKKFRELYNNTNDSVMFLQVMPDGHLGRFLEVNNMTCELLHYSREELLQMSVQDIRTTFVTDEMERLIQDIEKNLHEQKPATFESLFVRRDGIKIPVEINEVITENRGQKVALVIARDITRRKHAEAALIEANRKLALLSSITRHDILNQLTVLRSYQLLTKNIATDPLLKTYLEKERDAAKTIYQLIDFTKEYENLGNPEPQWQDLKTTILQATSALSPGHVTITVEMENTEVLADPMLEKVFFNLADNALRYGETVTCITFSCQKTEGGLFVVCEDDGVGIPASEKENIFYRRFFRHTGFGMSLTREILDITGLSIRETGVFGKGARFEILIPEGSYRLASGA
jgi:PAS domain S-box-containing protein